MDSRLLASPGRLCAILVLRGRLPRRRSMAWVDCILLPLGCMMVMDDVFVVSNVVAEGIMTSDFDAVESMKAVLNKLRGLAKLVLCLNEFAIML